MDYINIYKFLENPEKSWNEVIKKRKNEYENSLFPTQGLVFENKKSIFDFQALKCKL